MQINKATTSFRFFSRFFCFIKNNNEIYYVYDVQFFLTFSAPYVLFSSSLSFFFVVFLPQHTHISLSYVILSALYSHPNCCWFLMYYTIWQAHPSGMPIVRHERCTIYIIYVDQLWFVIHNLLYYFHNKIFILQAKISCTSSSNNNRRRWRRRGNYDNGIIGCPGENELA